MWTPWKSVSYSQLIPWGQINLQSKQTQQNEIISFKTIPVGENAINQISGVLYSPGKFNYGAMFILGNPVTRTVSPCQYSDISSSFTRECSQYVEKTKSSKIYNEQLLEFHDL